MMKRTCQDSSTAGSGRGDGVGSPLPHGGTFGRDGPQGAPTALPPGPVSTAPQAAGAALPPPENANVLLDLDPDTLPSTLKKEGSDWMTMFNPKVKKVLDVELVHTLIHDR